MATVNLSLDWTGSLIDGTGLAPDDLASLKARLESARSEAIDEDMTLYANPSSIPPEKQPLDAGFFEMPERLLREYRKDRDGSELGQLLKTAARMRDSFDRVIVLGIGGSYMGAASADGIVLPSLPQ